MTVLLQLEYPIGENTFGEPKTTFKTFFPKFDNHTLQTSIEKTNEYPQAYEIPADWKKLFAGFQNAQRRKN